jgi:hypothetical protein
MAKKIQFYRQCRYERPTDDGKKWDEAWLPEALAKVGKTIYFPEEPEELWTVTSAGSTRRTGAEALDKVRTARRYKSTTDI